MINFHPGSNDELKPRISVIGVGGAGGNAVNNMIQSHLEGVEFIVANTDAQALSQSRTDRRIQLGATLTQGLGAGARPDIGRAAAEESLDELMGQLTGSNMVFITAGMGGGTGTGAAPVIARAAREHGILTVGVVTKPFSFEGQHRMRLAEQGIDELSQYVDTLIIIPNQNLFRIASERTTFAEAFKLADDVLYSGVRGVTDLMIMPGLINLDFADIRTVMGEMGKAVMGTGEAEGDKRALDAAEAAINNPLLEDLSMKGARGVLINITGGLDMTLFEADEAANRIRDEVDPEANIIFGSTFDERMNGRIRVSVVATGIDAAALQQPKPTLISLVDQKPQAQPQAARAAASNVQTFAKPAAQPAQPAPQAAPAMAQGLAAQPTTMNVGNTLADRVGGAAFNGSAALNRQQAHEPALAQTIAMEDEMDARQMEQMLQVRDPAPRQAAHTESLQEKALQGTLRMETRPEQRPEPRMEHRAEPRMEHRAVPAPHADPADHAEAHRRPSNFLNRLMNKPVPAAHHAQPAHAAPTAPAPRAAQPAAQTMSPRPAPQMEGMAPTRVSPGDRLPTSRAADEDMLDIPAFLRRQAN
ncbi:cell division protein FtsZ [mine drainage metagenome]|uniref:Cell division protein FtsZ n=1 Tax=mine drainage metagenome TaxID=410659 RepID=A0A1J5T146_9ZZZZ